MLVFVPVSKFGVFSSCVFNYSEHLGIKRRLAGNGNLINRPELEFTLQHYLCRCFIIHS